jgi:hypothetical protein
MASVAPKDLTIKTGSRTVSPEQGLREAVIRKVKNAAAYRVLSTLEAALYFDVKPRTIHRWKFDAKLKGGGRRGSITIESITLWEKIRARKRRLD